MDAAVFVAAMEEVPQMKTTVFVAAIEASMLAEGHVMSPQRGRERGRAKGAENSGNSFRDGRVGF
jgi:hypothetical protein